MSVSFRVFVDGSSGTTGLRIADRLAGRPELELLSISEEGRKDVHERAKVINSADLAFLCLPDDAAREVMPLLRPDVKILDTSTAHRTAPGWVYGFPELSSQRAKITSSCRVAVPGCHASGFISLVAPLVSLGLVPESYPFVCHSLTGYSGGGKKMIGQYRDAQRPASYDSPRAYGLSLHHKHLPEMKQICGLDSAPVFCPIVDDYYCGMETAVPIRLELLETSCEEIVKALTAYYAGEPLIRVHPLNELPPDGTLAGNALAGTDRLEIFAPSSPDGEQMLLISLFDNLGKGSSGAAIQCMNLMLGLEETQGLEL